MIPGYINDWFRIIEEMHNDNTYKLAWGRGIVECIVFDKIEIKNNDYNVYFEDIAKNVMKYYWNQLFYFNLKQAAYKDKKVAIYNQVEILIEEFKKQRGSNLPLWFSDAYSIIEKNDLLFETYNKAIKKIVRVFHENVAYRFFNATNKDKILVYKYDKKIDYITFTKEAIKNIKEYSIILSRLLNYKWSILLEKYNYCPKILSKVSGASDAKIKRKSLLEYKTQLLKEFEGEKIIDFYTGEELAKDDISIDHVIPWSFMYSDDIWNLVVTSKSHNSSKSNTVPKKEDIEKLKLRNSKLIGVVDDKYKSFIEEAILNNYVDKFYFEMRV